ncbi:YdcF family protein, partial [Bordetella pertussis]
SLSPWLPDQRSFDASRSIIKEYAGLFVYWLRGWV